MFSQPDLTGMDEPASAPPGIIAQSAKELGTGNDASGAPYVLGLDIGTSSVGWAIIDLDSAGEPCRIRSLGVRCFEAGVEGDIEQGKDASRAAARRQARLARRQLWRRARRLAKVFHVLQRHGLLPQGPARTPQDRHDLLAELDRQLCRKHVPQGDRVAAHVLPYRLRAAALDNVLEDHELGRALYHLAQRRGFLSNRRDDRSASEKNSDTKADDLGAVKQGIETLREEMRRMGTRTLGEHFSKIDPEQQRIRQRWTSRQMYLDEFEAIWSAQAAARPERLTDQAKREIHRAIFHQRPLKPQTKLVGRCALEKPRSPGGLPPRRALLALPVAQRFRLLQKVNDLRVIEPTGAVRNLRDDERRKLLEALSAKEHMTFTEIRKLLELTATRKRRDRTTGQTVEVPGYSFNLEEGDETKICGDRTTARLLPVLGDRWTSMPETEREELVRDLVEFNFPEALAEHLQRIHGFDKATAEALSKVSLEDDYAPYCRRALRRLVARMEQGVPFMTARKLEYPESFPVTAARDRLPPVREVIRDLRNPAVMRALTEMRKVVNALIRRHGRPEMIRVEMARDLKRPREDRKKLSEHMRQREKEREAARVRAKTEGHIANPGPDDIEKILLMEECRCTCPYTGRIITMDALFGPNPQFDVEHIIPMSISLDNTFANKTLCYHEENRHRKRNRTPYEAYAGDADRYQQIIQRVRQFQGRLRSAKLRRFQMTPEDIKAFYGEDFTARHLSDTRYASRLAAEYLGMLYGGQVDAAGRRRVQASSGSVTAYLRDEWYLNEILPSLPDSPAARAPAGATRYEKDRSDHRHHAIDAVAIALSSPRTVKLLADAAKDPAAHRRRRFAPIPLPWAAFRDEVKAAAARIIVSHRVDRRIAGALHAETNYGRPFSHGKEEYRHKRVPLERLSPDQVVDIVDDAVRRLVSEKLGDGTPEKVFKDPNNLPCFVCRDGRRIPIKKVRVREKLAARPVGAGPRLRYVASGKDSLHHTVIVARSLVRGEKWEDHPVDRLEVHRRLRERQPLIQKDWGPGVRYMFHLCKNDCIEMDVEPGNPAAGRAVYVVRGISEGDIVVRPHNDARTGKQIKEAGERKSFRISCVDIFRQRNARKVMVSPLGEVLPCRE